MKYYISTGAVQDKNYISKIVTVVAAALLTVAVVASGVQAKTTVPGHSSSRTDTNNNGYPDAGVYVNGHYNSYYAYDASGAYHLDLGDGRVQGVSDVSLLDQATLSECNYVNNYRADFGDNAFMDAGWIQNHITCSGYDGNGSYNYLIVHETDPRYTSNEDWALWGNWEYHVLTQSGDGNLVKVQPQTNL